MKAKNVVGIIRGFLWVFVFATEKKYLWKSYISKDSEVNNCFSFNNKKEIVLSTFERTKFNVNILHFLVFLIHKNKKWRSKHWIYINSKPLWNLFWLFDRKVQTFKWRTFNNLRNKFLLKKTHPIAILNNVFKKNISTRFYRRMWVQQKQK